MDGKSLRGTWNRLDRVVPLLNVVGQWTKTVIHQRVVPGDTIEHKVALEVLKDLVLTGRVVTADAAFCHQGMCETVVAGGGHYVLPVKDNQPQLVAAISSEFTAANPGPSPSTTFLGCVVFGEFEEVCVFFTELQLWNRLAPGAC